MDIVVTGFGLFRDHKLNPSWEAIRDGRLKIDLPNVNIITRQIPVEYEKVDEHVQKLWIQYKPILMVHVGLAAFEDSIRIEQVARQGPYLNDDMAKTAPHGHLRVCFDECKKQIAGESVEFECKRTCFDVDRICDKLNELQKSGTLAIPFKKSEDAGLYVCEYIYYKSLDVCNRVVFIHVPDLGVFSLEDITKSIEYVIRFLIEELNTVPTE